MIIAATNRNIGSMDKKMLIYFNNAIWIFLEKFIRIVVGFVFLGLISSQIGVRDFGVLTFAQTTATMLLCFANLGFDNVLINEFSKNDLREKNIFSTALISRVIISMVFVVFSILFVINYSMPSSTKWVYVISTISLIFQSQTTWFSYFQAKSKSLKIVKLSLISLIFSSSLKAYLLYKEAGIIWFSISYTFDFAISFFVIFIFSHNNFNIFSLKSFRIDILKYLLLKSWPLIASSILVVLYMRLDQVMIMKMMGAESVGVYNVAVKIAESYIFVPTALATSLYPLISKEFTKKNVRLYFDLIVSSSLLFGIITLFCCYWVIPLLFGDAYVKANEILAVTIFSSIFAIIGGACTNIMIIINLSYMRLVRAVVGLVINFILNLMMIPMYGIIGAAFSSLISQVFAAWLSNALSARTREYFMLQTKSIFTLGIIGTFDAVKIIINGIKERGDEKA